VSGALEGLRIIELVGLGPAPFAAMMLADHGAEVVRIHPLGAHSDVPLINSPHDLLARGRRSLAIDLKRAEGRDVLLEMAGRADGLIEGFRPGVAERLGLGPEALRAANPRLVYGRMTGWGQTGPLAPRAGHDINYIGLSGVLHAIGPAGGPPVVPLNLVGDFGGGGLMLAFGMLAGLLHAQRSGQGQVIDAAMTDGAALLAAMIWGFRAGGGWPGGRGENRLDGGAHYYGVYECADGGFLAVGCIEPKFRAEMYRLLGLEAAPLAEQEDPANWPRLRADLAAVFATRPRDAWAALFAGTDACVTPVLDWQEAPAHPHNAARATFAPIPGGHAPRPGPRFSATPAPPPGPVSVPGADSRSVLTDWGIGSERIAMLTAAGVI